MTIHLTPSQCKANALIQAADKPVAWLGAIRGGKTFGSVYSLIERMRKYPGLYIVASYTYGNIERNIQPYFEQILKDLELPYKLKSSFPKQIQILESFEKGAPVYATAYMFSAQDEESQKALQGLTARGAFLDEVILLPKNFVMQCVGRLSVEPPMLLMTANKSAPNHWLKTEWIDKGKVIQHETMTSENPHISKTSMQWYETLLEGHFKATMLGNEWAGEYANVSDYPQFTDELDKEDSLSQYFKVGYLSFARQCCVLYGYKSHTGGLNIAEAYMCDYPDAMKYIVSGKPLTDKVIVNATKHSHGSGLVEIKYEPDAWAEAQAKFINKVKIKLDLREKFSNIGAWIFKDDMKVEDITTEVLAVAMMCFYYGATVKPFKVKYKDKVGK